MVMMKCGCNSNATTVRNGKTIPCCAICCGIKEGWDEVDTNAPSLDGRKAKCFSCDRVVDSSLKLAFFRACPNEPFDQFYCGCWGWD